MASAIEARWSERRGVWHVRVPSFGWTRLHGVWTRDTTERDLLVGVRRQYGLRQVQGMTVRKVEHTGR